MDKKPKFKDLKELFAKFWYFIWEEDSALSWIVNAILAFVLIKFIIYPLLGLVLSTSHPVVAVVSGSMEHNNLDFDTWWENKKDFYEDLNITKSNFKEFSYKNGFNTGDIMVLKGKKPKDIKTGDVIVFQGSRPDPIIHRTIKEWNKEGRYYFQTKGDNNFRSNPDEVSISQDRIIGKAIFRIPLLGWIKIWFVKLLKLIGV